MRIVLKERANLNLYNKPEIHPNDIQNLVNAIWDNNLALFSKLIKKININEYYRDNFDEEGERTLVSEVLLNLCFYSSNTEFIKEILQKKPDINLPTRIYQDGSASYETLKTYLQTTKNNVQDNIYEADGFELLALKSYLSRIEIVMQALNIEDLSTHST
jgi:hypothetical protein